MERIVKWLVLAVMCIITPIIYALDSNEVGAYLRGTQLENYLVLIVPARKLMPEQTREMTRCTGNKYVFLALLMENNIPNTRGEWHNYDDTVMVILKDGTRSSSVSFVDDVKRGIDTIDFNFVTCRVLERLSYPIAFVYPGDYECRLVAFPKKFSWEDVKDIHLKFFGCDIIRLDIVKFDYVAFKNAIEGPHQKVFLGKIIKN